MNRLFYIYLILPVYLLLQSKQELKVFTFDDLTKKPLVCNHYYCSNSNKIFQIVSSAKSSWLFAKEKNTHYINDYKTFSHVKLVKKGYVPEAFEISQMKKASDTAQIYLKKMRKDFNYNFKNIVFKEDLSVDAEASKYSLSLYKDYFLAKDPRLKITIVNVSANYAISEEDKIKAAYNLKKLLAFDEKINIKIDNSLSA